MTTTGTQTIDLSAGAVEYTYPLTITESTGKDISADTITLSLGTYDAPGQWQAPDTDPPQDTTSQRVVQLLVGADLKPDLGTYYLWSLVNDGPERVPRRNQKVVIA